MIPPPNIAPFIITETDVSDILSHRRSEVIDQNVELTQ